MEAALSVVVALLLASGVLVTVRLVLGPSTLDRAVALDALVAVVMAGIGVLTAARQIPYYLPALLVLSFLGFTGSVSIARFLALRDEAGGEDPDANYGPEEGSRGGHGRGGRRGDRDGEERGSTADDGRGGRRGGGPEQGSGG
ncbi:monovalent cation/H+ antiporter complex subunit F [Streptomyces marispadix]|uniref:Monovalent cation/H+ antiporter complex subunit F n=1 Tax=Streptomyces marispadix TaxID=2922868 RepID=A0ABS9T642_9ACTN|nr:monovalent cation/H+ antiporter complex subunit F [Streptomyces marispadix]MCH6164007.1 monovalent cation/H+ antiporter complex subunit F [Streptomyces marispadix]